MNPLFLAFAVPVLAQDVTPLEAQAVIAEVKGDGVVAVFRGEPVPAGIEPSFGIRSLSFRFDDGSEIGFQPQGTLHHCDWFTEVFSPRGHYVLLPQDHYGPFHVVELAKLDTYLAGGEPLAVVGQDPGQGRGAWVHSDARWLNARTVFYKAGLEDLSSFTWKIPQGPRQED
jgi:hypothetical protein